MVTNSCKNILLIMKLQGRRKNIDSTITAQYQSKILSTKYHPEKKTIQ